MQCLLINIKIISNRQLILLNKAKKLVSTGGKLNVDSVQNSKFALILSLAIEIVSDVLGYFSILINQHQSIIVTVIEFL